MAWISTTSSQVLQAFADERRRIISPWRVLILARRLARADGAPLPSIEKADEIIRVLVRTGAISGVEGVHHVFRIDVPFAQILPVSDEQIIQEAHPCAVFSCLTALAYHSLTNIIPKCIYVTDYGVAREHRIPLGTSPDDWIDLDLPPAKRLSNIGKTPVTWWRTKPEWDFGHMVGFSQGLGIYVTDVERTLMDGLRAPDYFGGISTVLLAFRDARERLIVDKLIAYVERLESGILRQRVGYLLDLLHLENPHRQVWISQLQRGGSMKLVATAPYSPVYSETWNLSLNVPGELISQLQE